MSRVALLALLVLFAGCIERVPAPEPDEAAPAPEEDERGCPAALPAPADRSGEGAVTLLTYTSFPFASGDFADFTERTGWTVSIVHAGDAGEALTRAIVAKEAPFADAVFGVDNALVHRAREADVFLPYTSPGLAGVPDAIRAPFCEGGALTATPVDQGFVTLNADPAWFDERGLPPPAALADLANETYAPLTVVENPYTSSPGFAFLLATVATFGDATGAPAADDPARDYRAFWRDFVANGGKVVTDWDTAYGREFTQGYDETGAHERPLVVSYSTSPAYVPMNGWGDATTANVDLPGGAWHQIEAVGILRGAKNAEGARALVDHMLTRDFQERFAFANVVYPVVEAAAEPEAYAEHAPRPAAPASLDPALVEERRDAWLQGFREATGQV